jgi:hypothetical protein
MRTFIGYKLLGKKAARKQRRREATHRVRDGLKLHLEALVASRIRNRLGFNNAYVGAGWASPEPFQEAVDAVGFPFRHDFHASVPAVLHGAAHGKPTGFLDR